MTKYLLVAFLLLATPVFAQVVPHKMPIVVQADKIQIGSEFVPRCQTMAKVLAVPAGRTVEPDADSTFDCIEVAGTLKVSRSRDTVLRFTHLFILPGGTLDVGTEADPIPATRKVELIVRDVPIDTGRDPFQWGNGLLNFGRQDRWGAKKLEWTTLTVSVAATQTTVVLTEDPVGWRVGDELLFPDMDIPGAGGPRREPRVTVAGIMGRTITLSKPLAHDHFAQFDPDGTIVSLPYVANLTRNIVIRSENPQGTRGHVADIGHGASWREGYTELSGLGRTSANPLHSTTTDQGAIVQIGTNQVGRYSCAHKHHANGFGSASVGNVCRGVGPNPSSPKWGMVLHGVFDALIERNIAIDLSGSGFVTEDGYEVRNVYRQNFAAYNLGNAGEASDMSRLNIERLSPGAEGNGFWWRGTVQTIEGNVAINNSVGMNLFNVFQVAGHYPSVPGGALDTAFVQRTAAPVLMRQNKTLSNTQIGLEYWGAPRFPNDDHLSSHNAGHQFIAPISDPASPWLRRPIFVGKDGRGNCVSTNAAYTQTLELEDFRIVGCSTGLLGGGAINNVTLKKGVFQNAVNIDYFALFSTSLEHTDVIHRELPGFPKKYILFGKGQVWNGTDPLPNIGGSSWLTHRGSRFLLKNWQGTGKDFRLFEPQQLESLVCWPSAWGQHQWNSPEAGLTMGQCWEKFGLAYGGDLLKTAEATTLEGVINGVGAPGLTTTLGPPRFIVTFPAAHHSAVVEGGVITFEGVITGSQVGTHEGSEVRIDGGPPFLVLANPDVRPDLRRFQTRGAAAVTVGRHTITTTRLTPALAPIPASAMTFTYTVGPVIVQPPPPPVDVCPNVPGVQTTVPMGLVLIGGQCAAPPPVDLCPNIAGVQTTMTGMELVDGQCVATPPPPVVTWVPLRSAGVYRAMIAGVPQDLWRICLSSLPCFEVVKKP